MGDDGEVYTFLNGTILLNTDDCTLETCDMSLAMFHYRPNFGVNIFFTALFGLFAISQLGLGIRYKTWGYMAGMVLGLVLEVVGYVGRIMLHDNPFPFNNFIIYLVPVTIGPAFITAAIYLCLSRIIVIYSPTLSRLRPATYTILFISCDILSLILQAAGGAIASAADDKATNDIGINIMIAGLVSQVASLTLFMGLCADFWWSAKRRAGQREPRFESLRQSKLWKAFLWSLAIATVAIYIRSAYRVAELCEGFDSALANNEGLFIGLESVMIGMAAIVLTVCHPGICFKGNFAAGNFSFRNKKGVEAKREGSESESA